MKFSDQVRQSMYGPSYYRELLGQPLGYSFRFYYSFAVLAALLIAIFLSISLAPAAFSFVSGIGSKILAYYPDGLVLTFKSGHVTTNAKEPYAVMFPEELRGAGEKENVSKLANLVVIDTAAPFSTDEFTGYRTAALLTGDSVAYRDSGKIVIQPLDRFPDMTIDKGKVASFVGKFQPYLKIFAALVPFLIFIGFIGAFSVKLLYFFVLALLVLLIARSRKIPIGYKKSYQLCLHLAIAPLLIYFAWPLLGGHRIPFFFTITFLVFALINLQSEAGAGAEKISAG